MPPRRPFRRLRRPFGTRRVPQRLQYAHRLMEHGKHQQAAALFLTLAENTDVSKKARVALLYIQAGRAMAKADEPTHAGNHIKKALQFMAKSERAHLLPTLSQRIIDEIMEIGHQELADELQLFVGQLVASAKEDNSSIQPLAPIPPHCNQCGANMHPDEVEQLSDGSIACAYCGSRVFSQGGSP